MALTITDKHYAATKCSCENPLTVVVSVHGIAVMGNTIIEEVSAI